MVRIRAESGWPPLAAPIGQILASQALLNILSARRYGTVLDLQEQVKGAMIARTARGRRHGFDRGSVREPLATLGHDAQSRSRTP